MYVGEYVLNLLDILCYLLHRGLCTLLTGPVLQCHAHMQDQRMCYVTVPCRFYFGPACIVVIHIDIDVVMLWGGLESCVGCLLV